MNRVILIGRLTKDVELKTTQSGISVASFGIAVDRSYKSQGGERETDFFNVVVWRQQAESCAQYLAKGKMVAVDGRIQQRNYTGQDGVKRTTFEVVAETVKFLTPMEAKTAEACVEDYDCLF